MSSCIITLHSLYEQMKSATEEKGNIIYYNGSKSFRMTYSELDENVKKISEKLISLQASNEVIGCFCGPSLPLPAILLGILHASSSFAVIDVHDTKKYLDNMMQFVSIKTFFVEDTFQQGSEFIFDEHWLLLDEITVAQHSIKIYKYILHHHELRNHISNMAYVVQTSGTTGSPKVVQVPHQCITSNIVHLRSIYDINFRDVILLASPLTFDPSIIDIFLAVTTGATLVIIPNHLKVMTKILQEIIVSFEITILQITPSLLQIFKHAFLSEKLLGQESKLRVLALGGERCPSVEKLKSIKSSENHTRIFNLYGLTEVSCWAMYNEVNFFNIQGKSEIALGIPLADTDVTVLDESGTGIKEGSGQLFMGGPKRWCAINDEPSTIFNGTMRPTGDWVHLTKNGEMFFEGRKDNMIKYNGKKFSMNSIDEIFEKMPEVSHHSAFFHENKSQIYIFVVPNSSLLKSEIDFQDFLYKKVKSLQKNMPPFKVLLVPEIPVTTHGKADRSKLLQFARLQLKRKGQNYFSVESLEGIVTALWKQYTGQRDVHTSDNFILCGGDSIAAVQFASEVQRKTCLLCSVLVDALLNSTFAKVSELLQKELLKLNLSADEMNIPSKVKGDTKNPEVTVSTYSPTSDVKPLFKMCYRQNRRGTSQLCLCLDCWCCYSLNFFNYKLGTIGFEVTCKFDMKKCIDASPCLVRFFHSNHLVCYIGSHSGLFSAVDVEQGTIIWEKQLPDRIESSACLSECGKFILVGCYDHKLYCYNAVDGELHWTLTTQAEIKSSVIVSPKNIAFVGSHDHFLYAVDVQVGKKIWASKIGEGSIFSSPAHFSNFVCAGSLDGIIAALDEDLGHVLWNYNYGKPFFSSPLVCSDSIFIGCVDGFLLRFDFNGNLISKFQTTGSVFSSASQLNSYFNPCRQNSKNEKNILFGSHDCHVYCCSYEGKKLWSYQFDSPVYAIPTSFVTSDGHQYVVGACVKGRIVIFDAENGNELCFYQCPGEVFSTPEILDGYVVVGCRDNFVYVFKIVDLT